MSELKPCPFCGGEARFVHAVGEWWVICESCRATSGAHTDKNFAIAAWNARADYHGYEQAAIEAWESIKAWNARAERGTLTAEQVREAIKANSWPETGMLLEFSDSSWQAIADELNARADTEYGWTVPATDENMARFGWVRERTCEQEERGWGTEGDHARVWLTCGHDCMVPTVQDLPNYCPNCGAKVVGE